jgi:two-component sensor histidine kinase
MSDADEVQKLLRQQAAIAAFGSFALAESDLTTVLTAAAKACAKGLSVRFCKICKYRPAENDLLVVAGYGWRPGVIGNVVSRADASSPQGRAFSTGEPSICNDLRNDNQFDLPPFYAEHGIIATIDVLIKGAHEPYGVLEIDSDDPQNYDQQDINFLTGFANVLAEAVATASRTALLQTTITQMQGLVEDKNRLLDQKKVLAEELQHRVRNNLQLIYGMLARQLSATDDKNVQRGIKAIGRRVSTLAQVYDHLLGEEMTRTTDFGTYVKSLCSSLGEVHSSAKITLSCESEEIMLDLDAVTALGIVVTELVTNSYDHAFPTGEGAIEVSVRRDPKDEEMATLVIKDDGLGFEVNPASKRHGIGLVARLAAQVRGKASVAASKGTTWTISFPLVATGRPAPEGDGTTDS